MDLNKINVGKNPPYEINVVIEITGGSSGGSPVKYEFDKDSGGIFVDRIVNTSMFYPCNYGSVSYTHLTLPTIRSVLLWGVGV